MHRSDDDKIVIFIKLYCTLMEHYCPNLIFSVFRNGAKSLGYTMYICLRY